MPDYAFDPTTWSSVLLGGYTTVAGIGALRQPGIWRKVVDELNASPALQILGGLLELMVGAVLFLANPWVPTDILACVMRTIGIFMIFEALMLTGFFDIYTQAWLRNLTNMQRGWAIFSIVLGLALGVAGAMRFY